MLLLSGLLMQIAIFTVNVDLDLHECAGWKNLVKISILS